MGLSKSILVVASSALIGAVVPPVASANDHELDVSVTRAPIVPDGTSTGAATDVVLTFTDRDPAVEGIALQPGGTVTVILPDDFTPGPGGNLIILQGWPQSPPAPPPAFPWMTTFSGHTVTATMTGPFDPTTTFGPGPKQVHALLTGFRNPRPGHYPISLIIDPDGTGAHVKSGIGRVRIIPNVRPAVNAVSLYSGPPGPPPPFFNPLYQRVTLGDAARRVGLYLWGRNGEPLLGVDLVRVTRSRYHLVQNGTRAVGEVWISPPDEAEDFSLESVPVPIPPPAGMLTGPPSALDAGFVLGVPVGVLGIQLVPDPVEPGEYEIEIRLFGGNRERLFVEVVENDNN